MRPPICTEPTTKATMLAAMNSDLTRFIILPGTEGALLPAIAGPALRRLSGSCEAACAARRAAAMKLEWPERGVAGRAPPSAASEAAMRAAGLPRAGGGPEPGSSG